MDKERIEEAIKKLKSGKGLSDEDLEILYCHYDYLVDALEIEGERLQIIWSYFYNTLREIKYMLNSRKSK